MESIALTPKERKDLIVGMKRERKPSRRLRMHIVLLAADGHRPAQIARVLYCSRTTVYTLVERFMEEGQSAFDDRKRRGPPPLLDDAANARIERLVEEELPTSHGWLRSRWSCGLLVLHLFRERAVMVSQETVRRALHHLGFRWRRPRPVPPSKDPEQKRERLQKILKMLREQKASFFQDVYPRSRRTRGSGLLGCAKENKRAAAYSGEGPQSVDLRGTQLLYGPLALGNGRAQKR
jgi:transposase